MLIFLFYKIKYLYLSRYFKSLTFKIQENETENHYCFISTSFEL